MSLTKVMSFVAILISVIFYWTTSNVCRYNFAIDKKTKLLNILTEEIDPSIKKTNVYYYKENMVSVIEEILREGESIFFWSSDLLEDLYIFDLINEIINEVEV